MLHPTCKVHGRKGCNDTLFFLWLATQSIACGSHGRGMGRAWASLPKHACQGSSASMWVEVTWYRADRSFPPERGGRNQEPDCNSLSNHLASSLPWSNATNCCPFLRAVAKPQSSLSEENGKFKPRVRSMKSQVLASNGKMGEEALTTGSKSLMVMTWESGEGSGRRGRDSEKRK